MCKGLFTVHGVGVTHKNVIIRNLLCFSKLSESYPGGGENVWGVDIVVEPFLGGIDDFLGVAAKPSAPPAEAAVGYDVVAAGAHQPQILVPTLRAVVIHEMGLKPEVQIIPGPGDIVGKHKENGIAHLPGDPVDRGSIIGRRAQPVEGVRFRQGDVIAPPDVDRDRFTRGDAIEHPAVGLRGRVPEGEFAPNQRFDVGKILFTLPVPFQIDVVAKKQDSRIKIITFFDNMAAGVAYPFFEKERQPPYNGILPF